MHEEKKEEEDLCRCIDTTTQDFIKKSQRKSDYGHQKQFWLHEYQQN